MIRKAAIRIAHSLAEGRKSTRHVDAGARLDLVHLGAEEAERIGLITEVVDDDALPERTRTLIAEIRRTSPNARRLYAEYLNRMLPTASNADLYRSLITDECREGLRAFADKRAPDYKR